MPGLANLGNTCGISSVIQCIAKTQQLHDIIVTDLNPKCKDGRTFTLTAEVADVVKLLDNGRDVNPGRLVQQFFGR